MGGDSKVARLLGPLLALALATGPAMAQDSPDELARRHFESGVAYLQESDYDNALKAFEKAYELSKRPEILLNIATVYERRSDLKNAVTALEQYLEVAPQGDQRGTVESRIANLKKRHRRGGAAPTGDAGTRRAEQRAQADPGRAGKPDEKSAERRTRAGLRAPRRRGRRRRRRGAHGYPGQGRVRRRQEQWRLLTALHQRRRLGEQDLWR